MARVLITIKDKNIVEIISTDQNVQFAFVDYDSSVIEPDTETHGFSYYDADRSMSEQEMDEEIAKIKSQFS